MIKENSIFYLATILENGNEVLKTQKFQDEEPIEGRKRSIKWLQNECIRLVGESKQRNLEIRLLFKMGKKINKLIVAVKIVNGEITHANSIIPLDNIYQNLNFEYAIYAKSQLNTGGMFRMPFEDYGPILNVNINLHPFLE